MSWDPGPYFHHCLHFQFTFSSYFQLPLLLSLALILCKQQSRRNGQLLCTRWEQSYLLCVKVQAKLATSAQLFTLPPSCLSTSPRGDKPYPLHLGNSTSTLHLTFH